MLSIADTEPKGRICLQPKVILLRFQSELKVIQDALWLQPVTRACRVEILEIAMADRNNGGVMGAWLRIFCRLQDQFAFGLGRVNPGVVDIDGHDVLKCDIAMGKSE